MQPIPFRQIHLDFHTSEHIVGVGDKFDPEQFARTLADARVNSINCFARCHHGYLYYESKRNPERHHPHLTRNLLKEQIEACHALGIKVPIYTTVQWDHFTARQHPEWLALEADGRVQGPGPFEPGFRHNLLVNTPYFDFLKAHVEELFELFPVDGLWFDIVKPLNDSSIWARSQMRDLGMDPANPEARERFGILAINRFKTEMSAFVRRFSPDCTIFYNEGHISPFNVPTLDAYTHLEIETIPSGEWGYTHFPITSRYARTLGKPYLGMTGKFHTEWGDFHSLKNREALEFECYQMLAVGASCSIGDQLHPNGLLDTASYRLIGDVYAQVEAKEPWVRGAQPVNEIGVMLPPSFGDEVTRPAVRQRDRVPRSSAGAFQMLAADGYQFDYISPKSDFSRYKVILLTDDVPLNAESAAKLESYVASGGKVIASFRGGLLRETGDFPAFFGVHFEQESPFNPDFVVPDGFVAAGLPATEHVMYLRGAQVSAVNDARVIAQTMRPYFNRTHEHFMSHKHAPSNGETVYPAVIEHGGVVYFAHPIFSQYQHNAPRWTHTMLRNALQHLIGQPLITHNGPSTLQVFVNEQADSRGTRWIVHLLHYIPIRRSDTIDVIEDVIPLYDLQLCLRLPHTVRSARLVPEGEAIQFDAGQGAVVLRVDKLCGHAMIEVNLGS